MRISKIVRRMLLVIPSLLLWSSLTWGQGWGPSVRVNVAVVPARWVRVDHRWEREWQEREWREQEWREREWRRRHRREEWREHRWRGRNYRGY